MGVTLRLQVIDMERYERRLLPAFDAWRQRRDRRPVMALLGEAVVQAPEGASPLDLNDFKRHERYVQRSKELEGALAREDRAAVDELLSLLSELSRAQWEPGLITRATAAGALRDLGAERGDAEADRTMDWVFPALLDLLCLPWRAPLSPVQDVGSNVLADWLTAAPSRLQRIFEGMPSGADLAVSTGESTTLLSDGEVALLGEALSRPSDRQPTGRLQRELEHLGAMVELVRRQPGLRLGLTWT